MISLLAKLARTAVAVLSWSMTLSLGCRQFTSMRLTPYAYRKLIAQYFDILDDNCSDLPRDAMRQSGLCRSPVSVRLSVTFVYCIQTAEDVKLLSRPGSPIILVVRPHEPILISKENSFSRGVKYGGGGICDFRLKSPFISETV